MLAWGEELVPLVDFGEVLSTFGLHLFMYRCVMVLSMIISFLCLTNVETSIVSISDICGMQETSSNQILNAGESVVLYFWGQKDKRGKLWG